MRRWPARLARTLALAFTGVTACAAHLPRAPPAPVAVTGTALTVEAQSADDGDGLPTLAALAGEVVPRLARWGGLRAPTRVIVVPSHSALEAEVHRPGYGWLRAWARNDVVYLQSPRTWNPFGLRPTRDALRDVLTHELSHCVMYQAAATPTTWTEKEIPLWFREGFASWTAHQAWKRLTRVELARDLRAHPDVDPFGQAEALYRTDEALVYASAHWAFDLLAQQGEEKVRALFAQMHEGFGFPAAFALIYGETQAAFEGEALAALKRRDSGA